MISVSNALVCYESGPLAPLVPSAGEFLKEQIPGFRCLFVYTGALAQTNWIARWGEDDGQHQIHLQACLRKT